MVHSRNSCVVAEGYLGMGAEGAAAVAAEDVVADAAAEGAVVPSVVAAEATLAHGRSSWASVDPRQALVL